MKEHQPNLLERTSEFIDKRIIIFGSLAIDYWVTGILLAMMSTWLAWKLVLSPGLVSFPDRTIGIAVLGAVDVPNRTLVYVLCISVALLSFSITLLGTRVLFHADSFLPTPYPRVIGVLCSFLVCFLSFYLSTGASFFLELFVIGFEIGVFLWGMGVLTNKASDVVKKAVELKNIFFAFLVTFVCFLIVFVLFYSTLLINKYTTLLVLPVMLFVLFLINRLDVLIQKQNKAVGQTVILNAIRLLTLFPLAFPLANEIRYAWPQLAITARRLSAYLLVVFFVLSAGWLYVMFWWKKRGSDPLELEKRISQNFLISFTVFYYYYSSKIINSFDLFHHGENLLPTQQLFQFHKVPFVDILPTHGLSTTWSQIFYSLVNSYHPLETWMWNWIIYVITIVLLYWVLNQFFHPVFSLFCCLVLPLSSIFDSYYSILALPALGLVFFIEKPGGKRAAVLTAIWVFVMLWRLDFGIATSLGLIALSAVWFLRVIFSQNKELLKQSLKIGLETGFIWLVTLVIFASLAYFSKTSFFSIIQNILDFLKIQNLSMTGLTMFVKGSPQIFIQYILLPFISIFYVALFIVEALKKDKMDWRTWAGVVFLALVTLVMTIRSTQRHSLMEGYQPYLSAFLGLLLPVFLLKLRKKNNTEIVFLSGILVYFLLFPSSQILLKTEYGFQFEQRRNGEPRVTVMDLTNTTNIVQFFQKNLSGDETFYDFANAPLLHVLAGKRFPMYIIPTMYTTSDSIQYSQLLTLSQEVQSNLLPFVVFRSGWGDDAIDGVPTEVRSYRIAEFLYNHFEPFIQIDNFQIWKLKTLSPEAVQGWELFTRSNSIVQVFNLQKLPYIWGTFDPFLASEMTATLLQIVHLDRFEPNVSYEFEVPADTDRSSGNYLKFKLKSDEPSAIEIRLNDLDSSKVIFDTIPSGKTETYMVRISVLSMWYEPGLTTIKVIASAPVEVENITLRKGD